VRLPIEYLWLIPAIPLVAAGLIALAKQPRRRFAAWLSVGSMGISFILSCFAFAGTLGRSSGSADFHEFKNVDWFQLGKQSFQIGWVLDPLSAVMLVMVTFVGLLIFIYSLGYMAHDENFTRFFCFLSLFAAAMLGVVIANNLLLLFMCWELVGLASYLLIGFWYQKPSAAAAAKKAFITTRIGDVLFFLGILWLYSESGTLLFYDRDAQGCLQNPLTDMQTRVTVGGLALTTAIGLLIFCGAIGKSGQVPLHVWLPDAMEGPTPVSALIHAATMVAAGVFLVARVYPLMAANAGEVGNWAPGIHISGLTVVAWVGAITALFAASIAVAQTDIKRILAYSTVSQLGFMMLGLGVGGVAVGIFHLITHAFFKALLFLGAGSVIHGCHEEQDIRRMGGLRKYMPVTFATYAIGMMALSGVPLFFSGFWSKDGILEKAHEWSGSHWPASGNVLGVLFTPFHLGVFAAMLTAFYMTRQMCYVFFGSYRGADRAQLHGEESRAHSVEPHESPDVMTWPLRILAAFAILLGFLGTPVWPWFQSYLNGAPLEFEFGKLFEGPVLFTLTLSTFLVIGGVMLGWWLYGQKPIQSADEQDPLERVRPEIFGLLRRKFFIDEVYEMTVIRFNAWWARVCDGLDFWLWNGLVHAVAYVVVGLAWIDQVFDQFVINLGFDEGCKGAGQGGKLLSRLQNGRVQDYLRVIGVALAVLVLVMIWGCSAR
jgi:NADH-quinone oxidoreductase subunit L